MGWRVPRFLTQERERPTATAPWHCFVRSDAPRHCSAPCLELVLRSDKEGVDQTAKGRLQLLAGRGSQRLKTRL